MNQNSTSPSNLRDLDWLLATEVVSPGNPKGRFWRYLERGTVFDFWGDGWPFRPTTHLVDAMKVEAALSKQGVSFECRHLTASTGQWTACFYWGNEHAKAIEDTLPLAISKAGELYVQIQKSKAELEALHGQE